MTKSKVIVLLGTSQKSWEDAARGVVAKVSESIGKITRIDVVHQSAKIENGDISEFHATVHVWFDLEKDGSPAPAGHDEQFAMSD